MNFGEVPGVAVDSKGNIYVFTRSNTATGPAYAPAAAQLLRVRPRGEFIREIGKGLYAWSEAHTVRIDKNDNIWAIDKGSDMVIKFNQAGRVTMVFGRRKESADEESKPWEHPNPPLPAINGLFRQPTDVAWDSEGNIYITDGYINSRVAKYDKNGDWVKSWGTKGTGPGQFNIPHAIVIDRNNNIFVADRTNRRIQVFDTDGKFHAHVHYRRASSAGYSSCLWRYADRRSSRCGDWSARIRYVSRQDRTRCCLSANRPIPDGCSRFRSTEKFSAIIGRSGRQLKQFSGVHQLACPSETEVYAAETVELARSEIDPAAGESDIERGTLVRCLRI